jgi:hydroxyacylglutathione hydrolase
MYLIPVPAFSDNYLWLLHDGKRAIVVDPGDAAPVASALQAYGLQLETILVTHHHADHTGGVDELRHTTGAIVYGPATERIPAPYFPLKQGDRAKALGYDFQIIDVPGHTAGHIAYYYPDLDGRPLLFCGDTLFSGGCGRLFEGTPAQMLASLDKLSALPGDTVVCCTHEYTLANLKFARTVDPENAALATHHTECLRKREQNLPTLPTTIAQELKINPFLRTRQPTIIAAARSFDTSADSDVAVFAAIRQLKNEFK